MKDILAQIVPTLRSLGFKGSGQNYRKTTRDAVLIVNFQKSSGGDRFYVNLGAQLLFVPTESGGEADPKSIKEYECIFRRRLDPPEGMHGWPYEMTAEMVEEFNTKLSSSYKDYLSPLSQVPGPITELTPEQFRNQGAQSILGGVHPKNALNFARIAFARGDLKRAKSFAVMGLADCPPFASGLRAMLKRVLSATEPGAESNIKPAAQSGDPSITDAPPPFN